MLILDMPEAAPVPVYETIQVAAATPSAVRKMTYGTCVLTFFADREGGGGAIISPEFYMEDFLPKDLKDTLRLPGGGGGNQELWDWHADWQNHLTVKVLQKPQHGKLNIDNGEYYPEIGYLGKDRIDLLVEGKDDKGRPIAMKQIYYINVILHSEMKKAIVSDKTFDQAIKKYCGTSTHHWRISSGEGGSSLTFNGSGEPGGVALPIATDLATWQTPDPLWSIFASASQTLIGFQDYPGATLAQTTGEGATAQITLDTNAAGYGWYMDRQWLNSWGAWTVDVADGAATPDEALAPRAALTPRITPSPLAPLPEGERLQVLAIQHLPCAFPHRARPLRPGLRLACLVAIR